MTELITLFDIFYSVILFFFLLGIASNKVNRNIDSDPSYKNYKKGLIIKLLGGVIFCLVYALYYKGGDTVNYFRGVDTFVDIFLYSPIDYFDILFQEYNTQARNLFFKVNNLPPAYMVRDSRTYMVIKLSSIFGIIGLGGFLPTTILISYFIYQWVWKLYSFLFDRYANLEKALNWSILYLPSTIFWGSGIMKDTFTFGATCFAVFGLHQLFIDKKRVISTLLQLVFAFYLIISIKAYIIFALIPGLLIFANFERLKSIESTLVKILIIPIAIGFVFLIINLLIFDLNDIFGKYAADKLLEEAATQNNDLQRSVYGSNSFNIGSFEPTLAGALSKFFPAINAAIFRPYLWEIGSPTMFFSAVENSIIFILFAWMLLSKPFNFYKSIISDPFMTFCLLFTIILGFGVGLSTANFGALVRYKIPFLPFVVFLILSKLEYFKKESKLEINLNKS